ncbi:glycogen debranching enzyme [Mytilinidion resinicola]|uniref:Glycogen debranching enzyme n=1 Tax=Mytilinidion resinicola TaxID=574789 RepID=A0A6A6Z785_9PEZI|nr:glycogen debranching enzyme [Mytilinidion resinicola]KAF2816962.1 glycogen debranching enzyme [Mytilinidion resinicola]
MVRLLGIHAVAGFMIGSTLAAIISPKLEATVSVSSTPTCSSDAIRLHLSDPPYENYFYEDCASSSHVVVTSPLENSNLTFIGPRLVVAWPAGNSGVVAFFAPENGKNGTLGIQLQNSIVTGQTLNPVYLPSKNPSSDNPQVGISGIINFNSSAILTVPILGSIRTIRDFTEGPSILITYIQDAIAFSEIPGRGVSLNRTWLDNVTTTYLDFVPINGSGAVSINRAVNTTLRFESGSYQFTASFDYPQLKPLSPSQVLDPSSSDLTQQNVDQTMSLSFLSYTTKLLAGAWRFLTYFGRDSMLSLLLLQPVLSEGEGGAIEAVIGAFLERVNRTDGSACHEETIGDYTTYLNRNKNITSTAPQCDYKMIDTDYYLPVILKNYFVDSTIGKSRLSAFFNITASVLEENSDLTYADLALIAVEKIMNTSAPFTADGGQIKDNLIHLKEGEIVGEWRDSTYGIGGGRIPYDVNTALVPAALHSIAALSSAGFFPEHPAWNETASQYAQVWEDKTLRFFEVTIPQSTAVSLVEQYVNQSAFTGPSHTDNITSDIVFHGLALDGNNNQSVVRVLNTDDCFRLFLLNSTNQTQLSSFLDQTADHILQPFPVGLSSPVGLFVANPAYGDDPVYAANFTNSAYHGTVVWSWQLAMTAAGLARQLGRCASTTPPDFCAQTALHAKIHTAYTHLWDLIEANAAQLSGEVWSWEYDSDGFRVVPLGALPPPPGTSPTESDIRQLWSLTFLAVHREEF